LGEKVRFAADSPLEGEGFEPSVPERDYAFRDHVHSLRSVTSRGGKPAEFADAIIDVVS
jgi:hypothetical protein